MQYYYPQVQGGYRWNLLAKCYYAIGRWPKNSGDIQISGANQTYLEFDPPLSEAEKTKIDAIMANPNTAALPSPNTNKTTFVVKDIWSYFQELLALIPGAELYFDKSAPDKPDFDIIAVNLPKSLALAEKDAVKNWYAGLISEK